jgi:hypothetical protein
MFIEDLTPILAEEMPPTDFFFSKKKRAIVKRETHQRDDATVKRHRVLYDGHGLDDIDFALEMTGSLGAFSTTNQCSVGNLAEQLKQRDLLVRQLQNQIKTVELNVINKMNWDFDQIIAYERHQIQQLQANIEEFQKNSQANKELVTQQKEMIKQLQTKIDLG